MRQLTEEFQTNPQKVWETSFFGRSLDAMVQEGLSNKLHRMPADAQEKVQQTLTKIINEGAQGLEDCSGIPSFFRELERLGMTPRERELIARENFLRILE